MIKNKKKILLSLFCIALFLLIFPATFFPKADAALAYLIQYNVDGDLTVIEQQLKTKDIPLTLRSDIPEKEGYKFVKWNTRANGSGYDYAPGSEYIRNEGTILYAQWVKSVDNSATTSVVMHYGKNSSTEIPEFELEPTNGFKNPTADSTNINTYSWEFWEYNNSTGSFVKKSYSTANDFTKYSVNNNGTIDNSNGYTTQLLVTPENKKGLKENFLLSGKDVGFTTRSGYGFSANGYVNFSKAITSGTGNVSGTLRVSMLYPEYNYAEYYSTDVGDFNDMIVNKVKDDNNTLTYSFNLRESTLNGNKDTLKVHYTPMWFPNSENGKYYSPVTCIRGLWTPIGEIRYDLKQEYMDRDGVRLNTYNIKGSLFDDMYTTHEEYRKDNAA